MGLASEALDKTVTPAFGARYVFYTRPGDFFWPHPDDPEFGVNILVCISRSLPPGQSSGSAFLAYRRDGSVERHELLPGTAIAVKARGCVHGREPLVKGEHVALLSIAPIAERRPGLLGPRYFNVNWTVTVMITGTVRHRAGLA